METNWFELKNGDHIGLNNEQIIYGKHRDESSGLIDAAIEGNSAFRFADFPDGFELLLHTGRGEIQIRNNKFRFTDSSTAVAFREELFRRFPHTQEMSHDKRFHHVAKAPLAALVVLLIVLLIGFRLANHPYYGRGRISALFNLIASIPLPALIIGWGLLSAIAAYNAQRIWKNYTQSETLLVKE